MLRLIAPSALLRQTELPVLPCGNSPQEFFSARFAAPTAAPIVNPAACLRLFHDLSLSLKLIFLNFEIAPNFGIDRALDRA
jgi:hypothetical protein